ncbi:MAG: PCMD domain-containing protein [Bacteroidaceae bacterium]|nr:PCMD domain-containing protein [Bacteroidaceae bacterium]
MKNLFVLLLMFVMTSNVWSEEGQLSFSNFDTWITRSIKESVLVGGHTQTLYEVGPTGSFNGSKAFTNQGGCPWANSNVYAKVCGVVKTNVSVYPDNHGSGKCAKLYTHVVKCKAIGIVNISVLAAGSLFTGSVIEPITSSSNPMSKINVGVPFTKRPKAIKFDYKYYNPGSNSRIKETGFSKSKIIEGKDMAECICLLQKRWEDENGKIHALRIGTMKVRFDKTTDGWIENKEFPIHYGDISKESFYRDWMGFVAGERAFYAINSKGKNVPINEEGWADANETPTHLIVKFDSSYGGAYIGTEGNTLWIDNVRFVY